MLDEMMRHQFLRKLPPKSTGREEFGAVFTEKFIKRPIPLADILATATAFTAVSIADAYKKFLPKLPDEIILCGGGARNKTLIKMLRQNIKSKMLFTDDFGINSDAKEAVSFAILAFATVKGIKNNIPAATGAKKSLVLGKIVPAQ